MFNRAGVFYSEDTTSGKQHSLRTKDEAEALAILHSKNEAHRQPVLNLQIARTYLTATDPGVGQRAVREIYVGEKVFIQRKRYAKRLYLSLS